MAVTTDKTNKPILPRGADVRPIDSYNRAALYSGKALDFDGTNDSVSTGTQTAFDMKSIAFYFIGAIDSSVNGFVMHTNDASYNKGVMIGHFTSTLTDECLSIGDGTNYTTTKETFNDGIHFAVFSWDATNSKYKIFVNGVELTTENNGSDSALISGITSPIFGKRAPLNDFYLDGGLSNIRLFNTALTATQVADLYNNPEKIVPTGVANSALRVWLPMQEGAGTTAYDGSAPLTDYVTNGDFSGGTNDWTASNATLSVEGGALKITSTGGNRPQGYQTITGLTVGRKYLLSAVARVGTTLHNMEIEISGIGASGSYNKTTSSTDTYIYTEFTAGSTTHIIQAKIDDSSVAAGQTGYFDDIKLLDLGNYGTINGATWVQGVGAPVAQTAVIDWNKWYLDHTNEVLIPQGLTSGRDLLGNLFENVRKQGALNLDGKSWAEVHDNASLDMTTAATMEAWVNCDDLVNPYQIIMVKSSNTFWTGNYGRYVLRANQNSVSWWFDDYTTLSKVYAISLSGYNHLVVAKDGTAEKLYINGALVSTQTGAATFTASPYSLVIGAQTSYQENWDNQIAQPRIYNRALTASEVLNNYNVTKDLYI